MRKALGFGLPLVVAGIINWINLNGIRVVTEGMGGATAVGLLAVGWGLGQRLSTTAAMFVTTAAFPLAARSLEQGQRASALRQLGHGGTLLVGLVLPAAVGLCLNTPPFVHLLISEQFRDITLSIMPLAVITGAVRNIRVHYADMAFILFEKTGLSVLVNLVEAVFMISLCAIGFAHDGVHGAVVGACAASTVGAVFAFALARPFGLPIPIWDWSRIVLASCAMAVAVLLVATFIDTMPDALRIFIKVVVGVSVYGTSLAFLFPGLLRDMRGQLSRQPPSKVSPELEPVSGKA